MEGRSGGAGGDKGGRDKTLVTKIANIQHAWRSAGTLARAGVISFLFFSQSKRFDINLQNKDAKPEIDEKLYPCVTAAAAAARTTARAV